METVNENSVNGSYFDFHKSLMGGKYFLNGREVAKSTIFWMRVRMAREEFALQRITVEGI